MTSCGVALVEGLVRRGVEVVFGIPGVHTLELYRGLTEHGVRHVTARHEQGAGFMADGYCRVAGKPGVAFVISGPGVTNVLTPLAQARHDGTPLLVVSGAVDRAHAGRAHGVIHDLPDQAGTTGSITCATFGIDDPAHVGAVLDEAWAVLGGRGGAPGPVHIQLPVDVARLPAVPSATPAQTGRGGEPQLAAPASLEAALELLGSAERPAIILGGGARDAGGPALELAAKLGAPVGLTINAKGAVPASHPLVVSSRLGFEPLAGLFLDADVVLAIGTQLSDLDWWMLERPFTFSGQLIRVDVDPGALARPECAVAILGEAAAVLEALVEALPSSGREAEAGARVRSALAAIEWPAEIADHLALVAALEQALPDERIVAVDSTQPGYAANHALDVEHARSWLMPIGFGTLGCALPMAIGAAVAAPTRPVLALAGDGGSLFTLAELATARDLGLSLPFVVWNNAGYGEIRDAMAASGIKALGTDASATDFASLAEGFGCRGERPRSLTEVSAAITNAFAAPVPTLIEVTPDAITS